MHTGICSGLSREEFSLEDRVEEPVVLFLATSSNGFGLKTPALFI
jgi:hypothetical protein